MTPFYEANLQLSLPMPSDYSFVWRLLGYRRVPLANAPTVLECPTTDTGMTMEAHLKLAVWTSQQLFAASTTACAVLNLTGGLLQNALAQQYNNMHAQALFNNGWAIMSSHHKLHWCSSTFRRVRHRQMECYLDRLEPENALWLYQYWPNCAPQFHDVMACAQWWPKLPIEWGLTRPGPGVDFTSEVELYTGQVANRGWRGERGTNEYTNAVSSPNPYG